ncbi:hypothetical protein [Photobacterium satsumensis]|uniref:hypothetical protein n=1 Tax=Photobacterium satsumensis TaxID=2910239 RepID=UPI003D14BED0
MPLVLYVGLSLFIAIEMMVMALLFSASKCVKKVMGLLWNPAYENNYHFFVGIKLLFL